MGNVVNLNGSSIVDHEHSDEFCNGHAHMYIILASKPACDIVWF